MRTRRLTFGTLVIAAAGVGLLFSAGPALAHHAFAAEFDADAPVRLEGTVAKVEWINPHSWIHIDVTNDSGEVERWMVEGGNPTALLRRGFTKNSLPVGTEIIVEGYRAKARLVTEARERIEQGIEAIPGFRVHGRPQLGLLAYGSDDVDPHAVWGRLTKRGWFTGVVTEPKGIHLMLSPAHAEVADAYLEDLREVVAEVRGGAESEKVEARYA